MLEFIRTHKRLVHFLLMMLIVPSFLIAGFEGLNRFGTSPNALVKIGSNTITQEEFDAAQKDKSRQLKQRMGESFDAQILSTPQAKQEILDTLITQYAMLGDTAQKRLRISDLSVQKAIFAIPEFTSESGQFDKARYLALLAAQGLTPAGFDASLRQDLMLQQLKTAVSFSAFVPKTLLTRFAALTSQEREVQELLINPNDFVSAVKISDEMLKAYYTKNIAQYVVPEEVSMQYLVLNADKVGAELTVSDQEVAAYYQQNNKRYASDEERRASHILIAVKKDATPEALLAAKSKATNILATVQKKPTDFAAIAKTHSADTSSAVNGGDLGFFSKGAMVPAFEEAVYQLKTGQISDLVKTDFGFHIIKLTEIKPSRGRALADVKTEIVAELKKQAFAKKYSQMAEVFSNTVYEQADSLQPVAQKLNLKIEQADHVVRAPRAGEQNIVLRNPKVLQALYSDDVLKNKHNTEAIEIAPNTLVAARVVLHKAEATKPFAEVKEDVRKAVVHQESTRLAKEAGLAKLQALKAHPDDTGFSDKKTVSRTRRDASNSLAINEIMKAEAVQLPAFVGVEARDGGFVIYRINQVSQPAVVEDLKRNVESQLNNFSMEQDMTRYLEFVKQREKIKILKPIVTKGSEKS